jgi:hypothetical protein
MESITQPKETFFISGIDNNITEKDIKGEQI